MDTQPAENAIVVIGNPESRRVRFFCDAAAQAGHPAPIALAYEDILTGRANVQAAVPEGAVVRLESPGENWSVERELVALGAEAGQTPAPAPDVLRNAPYDHGRIFFPGLWSLGYRRLLESLHRSLDRRRIRWMNHPHDILLMFDKLRCQRTLAEHGVPIPELLGPVSGYEPLRSVMRQTGHSRVFVKLNGGSSSSGVVALETNGPQVQATTSVEMAEGEGELRLYNSLRVRRYREEREVARLIDALAPHGLYAETWLPKAGWQGATFDLRVVVIAGQPRHVVMRASRGPLTNLHLGNRRGDVDAWLRQAPREMTDPAWRCCSRAAAVFSLSLYCGIDLMFTPGLRRHAVLEVNAFGDLLPNVISQGKDTYAAELEAMRELGP